MKVNVTIGSEFVRQFKRLRKKYKSLTNDYALFLASLKKNPIQGSDLGKGIRKIRMTIASKGKGKSGGARIITLNVQISQSPEEVIDVTLLTIYDKNEMESISDNFIQSLVKDIQKK